jgi:hypothetical protein
MFYGEEPASNIVTGDVFQAGLIPPEIKGVFREIL